ncbi:hypothetical protein BDV30DRAFT_219863 [Aspergillus minisclerotigenes]|uniref:Uncharacterized protein n=1 Tax=Aspergillus minisclerotigenes TaxID=656917 RepID=A0A5N6INS9_9EURO|nr:hypothetical protein BDV30DRAFT_219863 [Aspergillus minisclerotigenes]
MQKPRGCSVAKKMSISVVSMSILSLLNFPMCIEIVSDKSSRVMKRSGWSLFFFASSA